MGKVRRRSRWEGMWKFGMGVGGRELDGVDVYWDMWRDVSLGLAMGVDQRERISIPIHIEEKDVSMIDYTMASTCSASILGNSNQ
jgi:hypothetical protein